MQTQPEKHASYQRLRTRAVRVGDLWLGGDQPIRIQTMTTTDTMDTEATVAQTIRCIEAGAELVRITAPSKKEAENLRVIRDELHRRGYSVPLVADIHFTPNAAEIAARIVEKVRVNPGNYVDKKKFEQIEYTDTEYAEEIDRIRERFTPLVRICKEHGTAMRIGTNHGSLSDRIMSRYGDTAIGMVESAMEFLRIARAEDYHQIVLSMKSSNPIVMVEAYRLLVQHMEQEFGECYPLHLGVTEAGDGEDGRIKSAIGIGTLLQEGIGDTIRVSLTEDPEFELPVCKDLVKKVETLKGASAPLCFGEGLGVRFAPPSPREGGREDGSGVGGSPVPVVIADYMHADRISPEDLTAIGYRYSAALDKWNIGDSAADYIYTAGNVIEFALPGTLGVICNADAWKPELERHYPLFEAIRAFVAALPARLPIVIGAESHSSTVDEQLIDFACTAGTLLLDGIGNGVWLMNDPSKLHNSRVSGRTYMEVGSNAQFLNNTAFSILQATRTRISKTEYISCPSCGRTLFDLQETTAKIRAVTHHLKGVKIAIMGCIVNGPGEMADADFGYVGSGPGKITLYKGKEVVKRNVPSEVAVEELIGLLKEAGAWVEPLVEA
ncbi:MAG: 4-hydroxy-3-methylbut-2-en-1-yl diphosphate synthase [Chitinophagaceae bacterium]|nr:MAG: 4-hydroxy-3-methylbut-2-en-1-yl diphosphate synthase [Chitinophagaceae bacterium]